MDILNFGEITLFTLFGTFGEVLWFAFVDKFCQIGHNLRIFVAFWWNIVIYALCRILVKCRDLRIFPGKKFRLPGTKNYYAALEEEEEEEEEDYRLVAKG